jgi:hypothetical protein
VHKKPGRFSRVVRGQEHGVDAISSFHVLFPFSLSVMLLGSVEISAQRSPTIVESDCSVSTA